MIKFVIGDYVIFVKWYAEIMIKYTIFKHCGYINLLKFKSSRIFFWSIKVKLNLTFKFLYKKNLYQYNFGYTELTQKIITQNKFVLTTLLIIW